jgi:hypothetical protein
MNARPSFYVRVGNPDQCSYYHSRNLPQREFPELLRETVVQRREPGSVAFPNFATSLPQSLRQIPP